MLLVLPIETLRSFRNFTPTYKDHLRIISALCQIRYCDASLNVFCNLITFPNKEPNLLPPFLRANEQLFLLPQHSQQAANYDVKHCNLQRVSHSKAAQLSTVTRIRSQLLPRCCLSSMRESPMWARHQYEPKRSRLSSLMHFYNQD